MKRISWLVLILACIPLILQAGESGQTEAEKVPLEMLALTIGDWDLSSKMWMGPGVPPIKSKGTMHAEWILGGRYVYSVWNGQYMGQPFEGHGIDGYDTVKKMYVSVWMDNTGTGMLYSTGTCDAKKKTCTGISEGMNPVTGKRMISRSVSRWLDEDTFAMEMFSEDDAGNSSKMMELTARRKQ